MSSKIIKNNLLKNPKPIVEKYELINYHYKNPSLWKIENNVSYPVMILTKPKGMEQEDFDNFVNRITINIKPETDDKQSKVTRFGF